MSQIKPHPSVPKALVSQKRFCLLGRLLLVLFFASISTVMAEEPDSAASSTAVGASTAVDASTAVASRVVNGDVLYYSTLHDAFEAVLSAEAGGGTYNNPDEITLLADIVLDESIFLDTPKHIRLITDGGTRTIMRGNGNLDYPLFYVSGDLASLTLGKPETEGSLTSVGSLIIDGGYLNSPPVIANAPLIAISGRDAKLIMYDGVFIQNNYNRGTGVGTGLYQNGAGVFIRTAENDMDRLAEFVMKGGVIRGNTCDIQSNLAHGGGVMITGFALFTMEGGIIMNNTAYINGGGFMSGSRGSIKKTGGIIYGNDAPLELRNTSVNGIASPTIYGHAVFIANPETGWFRNDTVGENESLSYFGHPTDVGAAGEGDNWDSYNKTVFRRNLFIVSIAVPVILAAGVLVFFLVRKKIKQRRKETESAAINLDKPGIELTFQEKKVFDLLFTDQSLKMIADVLELTYAGVKFHCNKIYDKMNVKNRKELLAKYK